MSLLFRKLYDLFFRPSMDRWIRENEMVVWDAGSDVFSK
jgi:hypothetical protein